MATNTQIGKYLYSNVELPLYGKVLTFLNGRTNGASFVTIAGQKDILGDFNGDIIRAQGKVKTALSNLRFRSVVNEISQPQNGLSMFKIANKEDALTLIAEAGKIVDKMTQRTADAASIKNDSADSATQTPKTKKVNNMATKTATKKAPRLFINPETNKVEPFGAGRPSKAKLAYECDKDGKYLNETAALAFAENGGKSEDKLTKAELLDLLRKVRAERDEAIAARDTLAAAVGAMTGETETDSEAAEAEADETDNDGLDVEAEEVDDESAEAEATDAE